MKNQTNKKLLLSLVLCSLGLAAFGLRSFANLPQSDQANKPIQQGYGRAPYPPQSVIQANKPIQQGYGHAPYPPVDPMIGKQTQTGEALLLMLGFPLSV